MQKKQPYSTVKTTLFLLLGIIVLFVTASSFISMIVKYSASRRELSQKKEEFELLQNKKQEAIELYNSLETQEGRELYIREKYRVVKPGEELIILSDPTEETGDVLKKKTFWQKIKSMWQ